MKLPFEHFDLLAPIYESVIHPGAKDGFWKIVDLPKTGFLLDAGGGTGRVSNQAKQTGCSKILTDISFPMLREAGSKGNLSPVDSPVERLPFVNNQFDRIIMVDAFHHVNDQKLTANELWRILKPGGSLVIEEPDIRKFVVKLIALAEKITLMRSHFLAPAEIASTIHISRGYC